ncbi:MAG: 50S ribosome-binding GTPase, partial [Thermoguttaceae bacterium]|nr:50S ribosome-binding GTPase [Thermoguttaceae bacterium]
MNVTSEELRALKPIVVATIGPTNEGKTSLLRTLTGDPNFGLVNAFNGTTVRAEIQKVFYRGIAEILQLVDTPGFQTSGEILETLAEDAEVEARGGAFGLDDVLRVIPRNDDDYRHDLRAWNEVARCDVVILVANVVEDPNQSLIKHTLSILKNVGKPVVVAYNNLGDANDGGEKGENGGASGSEGKNET